MHGIVESLKIITRDKSYRIAKYAFDYALRHDRKKVTAIHKANIMYGITVIWLNYYDVCLGNYLMDCF